MKVLAGLFGLSSEAPREDPQSRLMIRDPSRKGKKGKANRDSTRVELLRTVLRDSLNRYGIPPAWVGAEALVSMSRSGVQGLHWRLLVRHWDPRLLMHSVALQQKLHKRAVTLDPSASNWLTGISWQFALPDESVCPGMPPPGMWTAAPSGVPAGTAVAPSANLIAGPVRIPDAGQAKRSGEAAARADLERLLAAREAEFQRRAGEGSGPPSQFPATQPFHVGQGAEAAARAELERLLATREADYQHRAGEGSGPPSQFPATQPFHTGQGAEAAARADLERLLSARAADYQGSAGDASGPPSQFTATQPAPLD